MLGFGGSHGCGSRACSPTLFSAFCLYFASFLFYLDFVAVVFQEKTWFFFVNLFFEFGTCL